MRCFEPPKRQDVRLVCPDCGTEFETEDGDGGCPRCHDYEEVENEVLKVLNDLRPQHLEDDEIREAVDDGAWRYLRQPRSASHQPKRPVPPQREKRRTHMLDKYKAEIISDHQETQEPLADSVPVPPTAYSIAQQLQKAVKDLAFMAPDVPVYVHIMVHEVCSRTAGELTTRFNPGTCPKAGGGSDKDGTSVWLTSEPDEFIKLTAFLA